MPASPALRLIALILVLLASPNAIGEILPAETAQSRVLRVGSGQAYAQPSEAAKAAMEGDVVEIEAGNYRHDVAVWTQRHLTIRGVHGRARLLADGRAAEGKAIWVFRGGDFRVENVEFIETRVPHRNGAGIRFEGGRLTVVNCLFRDNEMGILTGNDEVSELAVEGSEFHHNGYQDGASHHSLYVGRIASVKVSGSYFHHGRRGHLLKSRARESVIAYSRLTDEADGEASYELEFPNGGLAYVIGTTIQQSATTENPLMISYGVEGYTWPKNELYLINNTLVNELPRGGGFLRVSPGAQKVTAINNLLIGEGTLDLGMVARTGNAGAADEARFPPLSTDFRNNLRANWTDLVQPTLFTYRLQRGSPLVGKGVAPGDANGRELTPIMEYRHPLSAKPIPGGTPLSPGALQIPGKG